MNTELARDLQYRITKEALAMLVIHGSAAETKDYERAIILIGSAWGLDPQNAVSHLELITREKEAARGTAEPEETRHVLPESELPMNASGMETLAAMKTASATISNTPCATPWTSPRQAAP